MHHFALLLGYGAGAINPYLAFDTIRDLCREGVLVRAHRTQGGEELRQGRGQGHPQGDVEDGHLHRRVVHRRADLRSGRARATTLVDEYFTGTASRIEGIDLDVIATRGRGPARDRLPGPARRARAPRAAGRRRVPVAPRRGVPPLQPRHRLQAAALDPHRPLRRSSSSTRRSSTTRPTRLATLRGLFELKTGERPPVPIDEVEPVVRDREAVLDRRDELRLDQQGSAREPRDRDEPHRRALEHRRRRRGPRPLRAAAPTATRRAPRSSRSRRAGSASRASTS